QKEMKIGSGAEMLLSLIEKQIQKLTKSSNKEIVFNNSNFNSSLVPVKYRKIMKDIILQLVKNSIDHGIESKEDRILMGKPVKGYIHIENEIIGDRLYIYYEDDGRGLKIDEIKKVALKKKIINEVELRSEEESKFSKLIFVPGLSTAEKVTFTSGRGVGMDIVKKQIDYLSGEININFEKDKFCKFTLTFPL
ncbi:MAG: hypothetical protein KDK36_00215, partial [Leptospiraceae bacterium]|nr:hypothetical protein [Leptospiraceae bacterium]